MGDDTGLCRRPRARPHARTPARETLRRISDSWAPLCDHVAGPVIIIYSFMIIIFSQAVEDDEDGEGGVREAGGYWLKGMEVRGKGRKRREKRGGRWEKGGGRREKRGRRMEEGDRKRIREGERGNKSEEKGDVSENGQGRIVRQGSSGERGVNGGNKKRE